MQHFVITYNGKESVKKKYMYIKEYICMYVKESYIYN